MTTTTRLRLKKLREMEEKLGRCEDRLEEVSEAITMRIKEGVDSYEVSMDGGGARKFTKTSLKDLTALKESFYKDTLRIEAKVKALKNSEAMTILPRF